MVERHSEAVKRIFRSTKEGEWKGVEVAPLLVHNGGRSGAIGARESGVSEGSKAQVVGRLREAATLLWVSGASARAEAFQEVSEAVLSQGEVGELGSWLRCRRCEATSVNEDLAWAEALDAFLGRRSGTIERLRKGLPPDVVKLLRIRGMSAERISRAWRELGITGLGELKGALARQGLVQAGILDRETASELPRVIEEYEGGVRSWRKPDVQAAAVQLCGFLEASPQVERVSGVGEYGMGGSGVETLEVLVATRSTRAIVQRLAQWPALGSRVMEQGGCWSFLAGGVLPCRVRACEPEQYVVESYRLSSSKAHWEQLLAWAQGRGWALEAGFLWRCGASGREKVPVQSHAEMLRYLGLDRIDPELRQGLDEIPLAATGGLPKLLQPGDIQGDLHCHTTFSDGGSEPEAMVEEARNRGYSYLAITDHTKATWMGGGMDCAGVEAYLARLAEVSAKRTDVTLLRGLEVDILPDGSLDMPDEVLRRLDVVVASVHSMFHLPTGEQMERIRRAMEHPLVHILAHPTARLLGKRSALPVPVEALVEMARSTGTWLELNCNPERLDLSAPGLMLCRKKGVPVVLSSDAHHAETLSQIQWGIPEARRGGIEAADVMNTKPLEELREALGRKRRRRSGG